MPPELRHEHTVGELALSLLCHGLALESRLIGLAEARERLGGHLTVDETGSDHITVALSPQWHLEVPLMTSPATVSRLRLGDPGPLIDHCDEEWSVSLVPQPDFLRGVTPGGTRRSDLARTRSHFLLFHPLALRAEGAERRVHIIPPGRRDSLPLSWDDLLDTIGAALREGETDCVALRWIARVNAGEIAAALGPLMHAIKRNFDVVLTVECPPPTGAGAVDLLYAEGVDAICLPALALGEGTAQAVSRPAPLGETIETLGRAAQVFPRGAIMSTLMIGLESPLDTLSSISRLARMGVRAGFDLSLLRQEWTTLRRAWTRDDLRALWQHLEEELTEFKLQRPWTPHPRALMMGIPPTAFTCHTLRDDLHPDDKRRRPIQAIVRNLIRLRRRLRVRRVEQSFESAEL